MLGYPTHLLSTLQPIVGYPSTLSKCGRVTVSQRCTRILAACGRLITFTPGLRIHSKQVHTEVGYLVRSKNIFGRRYGLVSSLWCLLENGNSKKFSQYFLSKLSFDKLSWVIVIFLRNFFGFFSKVVFSSSSAGFHGISNQFFNWFGFREKVEYWG